MYEVLYETKKLTPRKRLIRMALMSSSQVKANVQKINNIFLACEARIHLKLNLSNGFRPIFNVCKNHPKN